MNPIEIRFELMKKGMRYVDVAKKCNTSSISIGSVIYRKFKSEKIMKCIAKIIEKPVKEVFPEYYENQKNRPQRNPYKLSEKIPNDNFQPTAEIK